MKTVSSGKLCLLCLSAVCLAMLLPPTASAVSTRELLRVEQNQAFQGLCRFSWLERCTSRSRRRSCR